MLCLIFFSIYQSFIQLFSFYSFHLVGSSVRLLYWIFRVVYLQKWHHFFFFIQSRSIQLVFHTHSKRKRRKRKMSIRSKFFLLPYYYIWSRVCVCVSAWIIIYNLHMRWHSELCLFNSILEFVQFFHFFFLYT